MLALTDNAAHTIRGLISQSDVPDGAGLRITNGPDDRSLTLSLAALPAEDDQVLDSSGARVFLDQRAAAVLDDKTLDAVTDPEGRLQFGITEQG